MALFSALLLTTLIAPVTVGLSRARIRGGEWAAALMAAATLPLVFWAWRSEQRIDLAWAPEWNVRLQLGFDAVSGPYALVTTAVGALVFAYAVPYIRKHLEDTQRPPREASRFLSLLGAFLAGMLFLLAARNLLLLYVFLDVTAVISFLLISFDRESRKARHAARVALIATTTPSVLFLVGALLFERETGGFSLLPTQALTPSPLLTLTASLLAVGGLAKAAQVPFQFWLLRAMVAPTPVSAYLHSAAMVAAGVYVLQRLSPVFEAAPEVQRVLLWIGLLSAAAGSYLALTRDHLKELLAGSTIAQLGYVTAMVGLGAPGAAVGFTLIHAFCKAPLFLTAGVVSQATGVSQLSRVGGLARSMPALAIGCGLACLGLAGAPLTAGFMKDELFLEAMAEQGGALTALAVIAIAATTAYCLRFWTGLFLGPAVKLEPFRGMIASTVLLALPVAVFGLWRAPLELLVESASAGIPGKGVEAPASFHLTGALRTWLPLFGWLLGGVLFAGLRVSGWEGLLPRARGLLERSAHPLMMAADQLSHLLHRFEVRDIRDRVGAALVPTAVLLGLGTLGAWGGITLEVGRIGREDWPLVAALGISGGAALLLVVRPWGRASLTVMLSTVGFALVAVFALAAAPDVALVMVLIETLSTLMFVAALSLFQGAARQAVQPSRRWRDRGIAVLCGLVAGFFSWGVLSGATGQRVSSEQIRLAESAHGKNVVSVVLSDFRGLDTAGEVTVIAVALISTLGLITLRGARG